jgi:hypothetical protein
MNSFPTIISNGYVPLIPILAWNIAFVGKLPPALEPKSYNARIPLLFRIGENAGRAIVFSLPLFVRTNILTTSGRYGLALFLFGTVLYFTSWLLVMCAPDSGWSKSVFGFTAPAFSPLFWLLGMSIMFDSYYFDVPYAYWHYALPSLCMIVFHFGHSLFVYKRLQRNDTRSEQLHR